MVDYNIHLMFEYRGERWLLDQTDCRKDQLKHYVRKLWHLYIMDHISPKWI